MRRRGRPPHPDVLTPREWEVLALLRDGLSNEEIAERLDISLSGAKWHVSEILSKLGVSSREEAARWQPERRPWWLSAAAPVGALWRKSSASWLAGAAAAGVTLAVAAGAGLLVWGLLRTGGGGDSQAATPGLRVGEPMSPPAAQGPTPTFPPPPTPEPFVGQPVDCPGGFPTPEDAIEACLLALPWNEDSSLIYVGDCDTPRPAPPSEAIFDRPCSTWEDKQASYRSYKIGDVAADAFDRLVLERYPDGWQAILWAGCSIQTHSDAEQARVSLNDDLSQIRIGDCMFPPPPMERPTVRIGPGQAVLGEWIGPLQTVLAENDELRLEINGGIFPGIAFYPGRGAKIAVDLRNVSGQRLSWTRLTAADVDLVGGDGTRYPATEIGGTIARSVPAGMPPGDSWGGWLVFPIEEFGLYTLHFPGFPGIELELTPEAFDQAMKSFYLGRQE